MFSTVRARITLAMASLVVLLGAASFFAVREVMQLEALSQQVAAIDEGTHRLHVVATAMRDAYAHQAHVVILNDRSHLDHYQETQAAAVLALQAARAVLVDVDDRTALDGIARVVTDLDVTFRDELLPTIPGPGGPAVAAAHHKAMHLVEDGQARADKLVARLHSRAGEIGKAVQAARDRLLFRCAALFAVALAFSVAVAFILDRQVSSPLRELEAAAARLGKGQLTTRVAAVGNHELASLARHWNEMAAGLQERERRLLEAERLAGIGRLAAGVAHEINNPLAVMLGYVRLVERRLGRSDNSDGNSDDDRAGLADLAMVRAEIKRCQEIVAGLLDLSRPPRLAAAPVDVVALVREAAAPLTPLPDGRARVEVTGNDQLQVVGDEGKLMQVLRNLLQNAVDAAPERAIDVAVFAENDNVVVDVKDHGPGLSDEARAHLFEPFFTSKAKGTGLGLAVSRANALAHGGALECLTTSPSGSGATFRLRLPQADAAVTV